MGLQNFPEGAAISLPLYKLYYFFWLLKPFA
jgi:zinc transporter ZupT